MTLELNLGQVIGTIVAAILAAGIITLIGSQMTIHSLKNQLITIKDQIVEFHGQNEGRFTRVEKALGLDDPDEAAFVRVSEARRAIEDNALEHNRLHGRLKDHEGRITGLERKSR
jgi:hypothetical protein